MGKMEVTFENGIYSNGTTTLVKNSAGEYEIGTLEQLKLFRDAVNQLKEDNTQEFSFKDQTVKLTADIDLQNEEWTPIGNIDAIFQGTFDGQRVEKSDLFLIVPAGGFQRGHPRRMQGRQKKSGQNGDDRDRNEKFYQGEGRLSFHCLLSPFRGYQSP